MLSIQASLLLSTNIYIPIIILTSVINIIKLNKLYTDREFDRKVTLPPAGTTR